MVYVEGGKNCKIMDPRSLWQICTSTFATLARPPPLLSSRCSIIIAWQRAGLFERCCAETWQANIPARGPRVGFNRPNIQNFWQTNTLRNSDESVLGGRYLWYGKHVCNRISSLVSFKSPWRKQEVESWGKRWDARGQDDLSKRKLATKLTATKHLQNHLLPHCGVLNGEASERKQSGQVPLPPRSIPPSCLLLS